MVLEDFTATLESVDPDSDFTPLPLFIYEANASDRSLRIKFPGAPSGQYMIKVYSLTKGRIDSGNFIVTTEAIVNSVSALTGSEHGGTLLKFEGINFSYDPYDNPVQVDGYDCIVQTTSPTEITCRIVELASAS